MAKVLDRPTAQESTRAEVEELYNKVCVDYRDRRVEIINRRIVVRELPTRAHAELVYRLMVQLIPFLTSQGWRIWPDIRLFLHPQVDRYVPDITVVPPSPRMWGEESVWASDTRLIVEVVSPSSVEDDHVVKPRACAMAGAPLYLVIDTFKGIATLMSEPSEKGYQQRTEVTLGKPLTLPAPWDLTIDTGKLIET